MKEKVICKMEHITKRFPGVTALSEVNLAIQEGEIMAIVGENGAGKSTLMNILSGVYPATEGTITFQGQERCFTSTREAQEAGIAMIHQELSLSHALSIAENIFQARLPKGKSGLLSKKKLYEQSTQLLKEVGLESVDPRTKVRDINVSQQQQVEIAKALSFHAKLLILDEPTSALTPTEANILHEIMMKLKKKGITMLYISHKMDEIMKISDRITVFRDGEYITTLETKDTQVERVIGLMVGREDQMLYQRSHHKTDYDTAKVVMEVQNIQIGNKVRDVSFSLYEGEILGITGLVGAGRSELLQGIFGADDKDGGIIKLDGKEVMIHHPSVAIRHGLALVPEGRKSQGLFLDFSVMKNMSIVNLYDHKNRFHLLDRKKERSSSEVYCKKLRVKTPSLEQKIVNLSGGNQQKVIIGRWLMNKPKILFLDEPTQGIDIGAKNEIYDIIEALSKQGVSVVVVSSEMQETIGLCDRILVMYEGKISGELLQKDFQEETIMTCMSGKKIN